MNALNLLKAATEAFPITEGLPGATAQPKHGLTMADDGRLCLNVFRRGGFQQVFLDAADLERSVSDIIEEIKANFAIADRHPSPRPPKCHDVRITDVQQECGTQLDALLEAVREAKKACVVLADAFVPEAERAGAHLQGLPRLVAHAVEHHRWHHDAMNADYVRRVETERDEACAALRSLVEAAKDWRHLADDGPGNLARYTGDRIETALHAARVALKK
jgi:hypothetical protein